MQRNFDTSGPSHYTSVSICSWHALCSSSVFFIFLFSKRSYVLQNKTCCTNKKIFHVKNILRIKICKIHRKKNYVVAIKRAVCQNQKRDSCRLNMSSTARKRNTGWQMYFSLFKSVLCRTKKTFVSYKNLGRGQ